MKNKWLLANCTILLMCTSMYFGTGWSLVLFSFPIAPKLTIDNYYLQFVPQVKAATEFFTWMTIVMLITAAVMIWKEWKTNYRWHGVIVFVAILAATFLTTQFIFPYNVKMGEGITDPLLLKETLNSWMDLNRIRVWLWTVQWAAVTAYFVQKIYRSAQ